MRRIIEAVLETVGTGHEPETCQENFSCKDKSVFPTVG